MDERGCLAYDRAAKDVGTFTITEPAPGDFKIFQRSQPDKADGAFTPGSGIPGPGERGQNAVCTQTLGGETTLVPVENVGEDGFRVKVNVENPLIATVSCVVDNYKPEKEPETGAVKWQK